MTHTAPLAGPAIAVFDLVKRFGALTAVGAGGSGINFAVPPGSTTALLGGNGAGKSSTIAMLLGLLLPSAGRIEIMGLDIADHRRQLLPLMNLCSPYVDLPGRLSVFENLLVYARLYGVERPKDRVRRLASELDLEGLLHRPTRHLSAGQKTRVALAKSLLNDPQVLLLDEPTASLDPDTADWVRTYLERYRARTKATILLASHNMSEVERLADDVLMMRAGAIVDRGAPQALIERYGRRTMEEVFLDIARGGAATAEAAE